MYRRCTLTGQQRTEIFICAIKNHHLISELPASKYTSITTTSLVLTQKINLLHQTPLAETTRTSSTTLVKLECQFLLKYTYFIYNTRIFYSLPKRSKRQVVSMLRCRIVFLKYLTIEWNSSV